MRVRLHAAFTALLAAVLFGATTPFAKFLLGTISPFMLAGLFYVGSAIGLGLTILVRSAFQAGREPISQTRIQKADVPWLAGAIVAGGVAGPALLMLGLAGTPAATGSLLLNLEGVFTAVIAWVVFRENVDLHVFLGMLAIVSGGVLLSWQPGGATSIPLGALLIAGACACWAIDNNLTRKVSTNDAMVIACLKGLTAGPVNLLIAYLLGTQWPGLQETAAAMATGFLGYGVSLVLFVVALRNLGSARTGAYFSVAPLFGLALSFAFWPEMPSVLFWCAAVLMGVGVWLHLRERHEHTHTHEPLTHTHRHRHDEHHQHEHDFDWDGAEPHTHPHVHTRITHTHPHFPDVHHRHPH